MQLVHAGDNVFQQGRWAYGKCTKRLGEQKWRPRVLGVRAQVPSKADSETTLKSRQACTHNPDKRVATTCQVVIAQVACDAIFYQASIIVRKIFSNQAVSVTVTNGGDGDTRPTCNSSEGGGSRVEACIIWFNNDRPEREW